MSYILRNLKPLGVGFKDVVCSITEEFICIDTEKGVMYEEDQLTSGALGKISLY